MLHDIQKTEVTTSGNHSVLGEKVAKRIVICADLDMRGEVISVMNALMGVAANGESGDTIGRFRRIASALSTPGTFSCGQ